MTEKRLNIHHDHESVVVSELEGTLLKDKDPFSYFMLVAFEASGLVRFVILLSLWPVIWLLDACGKGDYGLQIAIFVATVGLRISEIKSVARAVLPKFYLDDVDMEAWRLFSSCDKRVVVTKTPKIMVERFLEEHLRVDDIIGTDLVVNRFGYATGFVKDDLGSIHESVLTYFGDEQPCLGLGRPESCFTFLSICKDQCHPPFTGIKKKIHQHLIRPLPVIFHDGRLVKRPTPLTSLLIILWIPLGIILAIIRILMGMVLPMWAIPYMSQLFGGSVVVKGKPPPPPSGSNSGVLFVCTHTTRNRGRTDRICGRL